MSNIKENDSDDITLIDKTIKDDDNYSTALIILKEFVKALEIERSKVSISLLDDFSKDGHLVVSKYYEEIVTD